MRYLEFWFSHHPNGVVTMTLDESDISVFGSERGSGDYFSGRVRSLADMDRWLSEIGEDFEPGGDIPSIENWMRTHRKGIVTLFNSPDGFKVYLHRCSNPIR